ncbi:hypothetical protein ABT263_37830 [Kitasatospora sp. NPDC001603]|uniref:hypothetical protein n=1 Tax=Kitasatospora sp. NPDC001603 TaxID=3154388 RepID=UPI0033202726
MKIDPLTGMLFQMIVIEAPPRAEEKRKEPLDVEAQAQAPVIDRSLWEWLDGSDGSTPGESVVSVIADVSFICETGRIGLTLSSQEPARYVHCENVIVGISGQGELVEVLAVV